MTKPTKPLFVNLAYLRSLAETKINNEIENKVRKKIELNFMARRNLERTLEKWKLTTTRADQELNDRINKLI